MNVLIAKILQFVLMYPICVECHSPNYHSVEIVYERENRWQCIVKLHPKTCELNLYQIQMLPVGPG